MQTSKRTLTEDESKLNETYVGATVLYVASMFTLMVEVGGEGPGGAGGSDWVRSEGHRQAGESCRLCSHASDLLAWTCSI